MSNQVTTSDPSGVLKTLHATFDRQFGGMPDVVVRAPGRVNLIGEHTDYNDGFVMPLAIDRAAWIVARPRADRQVVLWSENFRDRQEFSLERVERAGAAGAWSNYTRGVVSVLQQAGHSLRGMDAVVWGDVPIGSGLSSSAALEVASALALVALSGLQPAISDLEIARLTQRAEIEFVGVNCGIMDQMISVLGRAGHALLIDCRSLDYEVVPLPGDCAVVVADTMKRRDLVDSKYNERRAECEEGARLLSARSLRDISWADFEERQHHLPDTIRRRCRHVIGENARVLKCAAALQAGDINQVGRLLAQSHASLRDDYAVSCGELDLMVKLALEQEAVYGARMTGAGFGGCTVNLVQRAQSAHFVTKLAEAYNNATGVEPALYICEAGQGARVLEKH